MKDTTPLLDYGVLGIMCIVFMSVIGYIFRLRYKENKAYVQELKEERRQQMDLIAQAIQNNNRIVENSNELVKGFIDIVGAFKALLNVVLDKEKNVRK